MELPVAAFLFVSPAVPLPDLNLLRSQTHIELLEEGYMVVAAQTFARSLLRPRGGRVP